MSLPFPSRLSRYTLYRRERWTTPDGRTVTADPPAGVVGGCGPNLHRFVLTLHFQGQMTCERIVTLLTAAGLAISKRQVVRLLTARLEMFRAEEEAVFSAGLGASAYVSVDDTGARHGGTACYTTQFGSDRFTAFRTGPSKSRLAFLRNLLGGTARYAINAAAAAYMRAANLAHGVIEALSQAEVLEFACEADWRAHLHALGLTELRVTPDPVRTASEGALWGAICAEDRLAGAVILSDDAGQFRVGDHALCWVHAERLVYKLIPANDRQHNAVEVTRRMIWWFYRQLKAFKLAPSPARAVELRARFDRIFKRRTGYATLDKLLKRLLANKDELVRVLERPDIPLNTNASENDIRAVVTKRKVSGGTVSENGRIARDVMLGLAKTCAKLKISFFDYLGARLEIPGPKIPPPRNPDRPQSHLIPRPEICPGSLPASPGQISGQAWVGSSGGGPDEVCEVWDFGSWDTESRADVIIEGQFEFHAGLGEAEHDVAGVAALVADGSAGDFSFGDEGADVVLARVGVERDFRAVEDA